jgi:hypothetical protein
MTVGIVCDNYKETEFVERLISAGFDDLDISDYGPTCKTIKVMLPNRDKVGELSKVVAAAEGHFAKNKNRFN